MSGVYEQRLRLRSRDVDMFRRLRSSELFHLLQEASIRHTEQLGMGRDKTLDRGILWVLMMQRIEIARMPEYDEDIVLKSWPGRTMHLLFPRHYGISTPAGETLVRASALWCLVDSESRRSVFPEKYGVEIEGVVTGEEIELPGVLQSAESAAHGDFTVPYSFVDINGHMNNARYVDVAEDMLGLAAQGRKLRAVRTEYQSEARLGETLRLSWGERESGCFTVVGETDRRVFRMELDYCD